MSEWLFVFTDKRCSPRPSLFHERNTYFSNSLLMISLMPCISLSCEIPLFSLIIFTSARAAIIFPKGLFNMRNCDEISVNLFFKKGYCFQSVLSLVSPSIAISAPSATVCSSESCSSSLTSSFGASFAHVKRV